MNYRNIFSKTLCVALLSLIAGSLTSAQAQKKTDIDLARLAPTSPDVRIIKVANRAIVGDDATIVIRVEWSAEARQVTEIVGFIASVEVEYADGSKNNNSQSVGASSRQADLRVLNKGSNQPRKFIARVTTDFKFTDANFATQTEEFTLSKANGFESTGPASPNTRPTGAFGLSRVRAKFTGCGANNHCFTIEWGAGPIASVTFNQFSIQGAITYVTGGSSPQRSASATSPGNARSAQLVIQDVKISDLLKIVVKATVKASATIRKNQTTQLQGSF
jgi:hypothetical protein